MGANAVNGVINIITKHSRATTSGLVLHTEVERSIFGKITWRF